MINRDIKSLDQKTQEKVSELISICKNNGIKVVIGEAKRSIFTQCVYALRGRIKDDPLAEKALSILGKEFAWKFYDYETHRVVTWTLDSNHLDGHAVDLIIYNKDGTKDWNFRGSSWKYLIDTAKNLGFNCGADWALPKTDPPHFEYRG